LVKTSTSNTFTANAKLFGKIYFPRLTTPISTAISSLINFGIQFVMFLCFTVFFIIQGANVHINWIAALTPLIVIQLAILGTGCGIIISALTTKYRDLQVMVSFGVMIWMYLSPVIISGSSLSEPIYKLMMLNPVSPAIELMRYGWLGSGTTPFIYWIIGFAVSVALFLLGTILFNRVEKTFMDTV
jgi:lipopolysaccharide transport system permease protein